MVGLVLAVVAVPEGAPVVEAVTVVPVVEAALPVEVVVPVEVVAVEVHPLVLPPH